MASLTPGVLSKLLKHASDRDVKVVGEHRSALLQVIEIVPRLANNGADPWASRGFFLKVSDSLHSTYVSISTDEADLIFSDKIQLGQFVHVARLDSASPFPILRGLKPIPKRRPCVGTPTDLNASESALAARSSNVDFLNKKKEANKKKKKVDLKVNASVKEMEMRRLNVDSMRRGWEKKTPRSNVAVRSKEITTSSDSSNVIIGKARLRKDSPAKHHPSAKLQFETKTSLPQVTSEPSKEDVTSPKECINRKSIVQVPLNLKNFNDRIETWDSLPSNIHDLGKGTLLRRDAAFLAAVDALHDASAADSVIQCMSKFAELSESAMQVSPGFLVENFLDLHQSIMEAGSVVDALLQTRRLQANTETFTLSQIPSPEICKCFSDRNADATSWTHAAVQTDLSRFSIFHNQEKKGNQPGHRNYVVLETPAQSTELQVKNHSPQNRKGPNNQGRSPDVSTKKGLSPKRRTGVSPKKSTKEEKLVWRKGRGLDEVASLSKKLLTVSREWFLKYLEDSLNDGFRSRLRKEGNEVTNVLGQLKRVNQWLEEAVGNGFEIDGRVELLKKKIYSFLLEQVDATSPSW